MRRVIVALTILIYSFFGLAGCHSVGVAGSKIANPSTPISKIYVYANDDDRFTDKNFPEIKVPPFLLKTQRLILDLLETRLPLVFSLNGIETKMVLKSRVDKADLEGTRDYPYYMTLTPAKGAFGSHTGTSITFNVNIRDNTTKKIIWVGQILFLNRNNPTLQYSAADDFAASLLSKLQENGVIRLVTEKPKTP